MPPESNATPLVRRVRVYLVDDHPFVREWLRTLLGMEAAIEVVGDAEDGATALAAFAVSLPDLLIVDLSLKRGTGLDLIKLVRDRHPSVRILVLSTHEEIGDVERAFRAGARGYVMKSESTDQIVPAIHQVYAGRVFAAPHVLGHLADRSFGRPRGDGRDPSDVLSDRELDVYRRLGDGQSTRRIADDLSVSLKTVQTYCARIKEKLGLADGIELLRTATLWRDRG